MQPRLWLVLFIILSGCATRFMAKSSGPSPTIFLFDREGQGLAGDNAEGTDKQFIPWSSEQVDSLVCMPAHDFESTIKSLRDRGSP